MAPIDRQIKACHTSDDALILLQHYITTTPPDSLTDENRKTMPAPVANLFDIYRDINRTNIFEYYHDAQMARDETLNLFNLGYCSLDHRGLAEKLFYTMCGKVLRIVRDMDYVPEEFQGLEAMLSDTYFCNYSIFQSMPDSWAIDQLFPIMPVHRLNEQPTRRAILADITCDSDGKIDHFIDLRDVKDVLELHEPNGQEYILGVFLVGAYQEILGDLHNLFGDTNAVHISLDDEGNYSIDHVIEGDTVSDVLRYVQYTKGDLVKLVRRAAERAMKDGRMTVESARMLVDAYQQGMEGYTYLE
jgi:arginine decarboxylase